MSGPETYITFYWPRNLYYIILDQNLILHSTGPETFITLYRTTILYYIILDQKLILHSTVPETYITLYWTRNLYYIILAKKLLLHSTGPETYITFYWPRNLYYIILDPESYITFLPLIYAPELEVKETTDTASSASFLDLYLEFDDSGQLSTKIYDKRDDFNFKIINFPNMCSDIPASPA